MLAHADDTVENVKRLRAEGRTADADAMLWRMRHAEAPVEGPGAGWPYAGGPGADMAGLRDAPSRRDGPVGAESREVKP